MNDVILWLLRCIERCRMSRLRFFLIGLGFAVMLPLSGAAEETLTGLNFIGYPSVTYKDGEGFSGGLSVMLFQYGDGQISPYNWNAIIEAEASTVGRKKLSLFWDQMHALGNRTRLTAYASFNRYLADDYVGLGNQNQYNQNLIDPDAPAFVDEQFYTYKRDWTYLTADIQWPAPVRNTRVLAGAGLQYIRVPQPDRASKLYRDAPRGIDGGFGNYLRLGLVYDTRDAEATPSAGVWTECLLAASHPLWGSDYNYGRFTLTDRRYWQLFPGLVYAQRVLLETMPGNPPFYAMNVLAGSYELHQGLGGATSLRGVPRFLFVGPHKFLMNVELRAELFSLMLLRQPFTFYVQPFLDSGRVWMKYNGDFELHTAYGCSFNVRWKKDAVYSLSLGRSAYEELAIYMSVGNLF
ncbi:MAG: BamA/TamA family outer membrane protein [candidate division KSB1 bacterium]|nr:BamA/TamA family outer membrane protein [candidate division KSB1 bacterium]